MKHKKRLAAGIAVFAVLTLLSHTGMTRGAAEALSEQVLAAAPEAIQQEGTENIEVGNLPVYDYRQQEIEESLGTAFSETICLLSPSSAAYSTYIVDESFGMRNNCVNSMTRCTARRSGGESFLPSC